MTAFDDDLAAAMRDIATTVPVLYRGTARRGYLDRSARLVAESGMGTDVQQIVLHLTASDAAAIVSDSEMQVGALGAADASGAPRYTVTDPPMPVDDGAMMAIFLVEGGCP